QRLLPAGAARNALDCAFWDLEAKRRGRRVWELAGLPPPGPVTTAFTLGIDAPAAMAEAARAVSTLPLLKLKMAGDEFDLDRVKAVRDGAPSARLVVDANEAWDIDRLRQLAPPLAALGVELIEQPLPAAADGPLAGFASPVPLCADESCHDAASLAGLGGRYRMVNVKLDKTGGLTEAFRVRRLAAQAGLGVMVGCMVSTSLAIAPAMLIAQGAAVADLDGPLLLDRDREGGLAFSGALIQPPEQGLWG
ncbi:MAG: dipeptide epimerase, partial [Alphaproteobacteria bacterium]|nr:dipeptide epimerase [Alphaproteobacteria bacterium]